MSGDQRAEIPTPTNEDIKREMEQLNDTANRLTSMVADVAQLLDECAALKVDYVKKMITLAKLKKENCQLKELNKILKQENEEAEQEIAVIRSMLEQQ